MAEDPIRAALLAPERPVEPDPAFADELFERLRAEMGHRPHPFIMRPTRRLASPTLRRALIAAAVLIVTFAALAAILWPLRGWLTDRSVPVTPVPTVENGRLVLSRAGQIVSMEPDGTGELVLTDTGADYSPVWSPDGTRIAFIRMSGRGSSIWVMNADGSQQVQVGNSGIMVQPPLWSPNGRYIAYSDLDAEPKTGAIWRVTPDGRERLQVTTHADMNALRDWSPDSGRLAFESDRDGGTDVWVMNADGSDATNLTPGRVTEWGPDFSPDGTRIVFYRGFGRRRQGGYSKTAIWTMNADGSDPVRLTDGTRSDIMPRWSPDGKWIVFRGDRLPPRADSSLVQLFRMAFDGSDLRALTDRDIQAFTFSWSPDSTTIVFVDGEPGRIDIIGIDGTGFRVVASGPDPMSGPDWQAVLTRASP